MRFIFLFHILKIEYNETNIQRYIEDAFMHQNNK